MQFKFEPHRRATCTPKHLTDYKYTWNSPKKERHAKHNSLACPLLHFVAISAGRSINSLQNRSITVATKPKRPSLFFGCPIFARSCPPRGSASWKERATAVSSRLDPAADGDAFAIVMPKCIIIHWTGYTPAKKRRKGPRRAQWGCRGGAEV